MKRTTRWRDVWLRVVSLGCPQRDLAALGTAVAAAVWHGHQLTPMTFSAVLSCSDLLALIRQPRAPGHLLSIHILHGYRMLPDDSVVERLRPDVRKIVLALDATDSQPVRFDFILQPQMRHVDVFHVSDFTSM